MTSRSPVIAAQDLSLTLGKGDGAVHILRGIDLVVEQGQTVALLGPSGSGKSSLMAVLSGLERASSGALVVAGADFAMMDEDALARARRGLQYPAIRKIIGRKTICPPTAIQK